MNISTTHLSTMDKGTTAESAKGTLADILVVDDNPVNVRLLANILVNLGYKVRKATNGEMALDAIDAITPDLILLDINMPGMDGYQVCQTLKSSPKNSDIPVIFISALDEMSDKLKGFDVGGIDYISKPFQLLEVQTRVKTHIALRQLQKQQQSSIEPLAPEMNVLPNKAEVKPVSVLPGFEWAIRRAPYIQGGFDFYDCYGVGENCFNLVLGEVPNPQETRSLENVPTLSQKAPHEWMPTAPLFWGQLQCGDRQFVYANTGNHLAFIRRANGTIEPL
ncbi:MAG TPA: response regulator, partial [Stenomitos sp.]